MDHLPADAGRHLPAVLELPAEIDYASAAAVRAHLAAALTARPPVLIIDLAGTQFCDSSALGELARAHRLAATGGTRIQLIVPPGPLTRLFALTGADQAWSVYPTLDAALTGSATPDTITRPAASTGPSPARRAPADLTPADGAPAPPPGAGETLT